MRHHSRVNTAVTTAITATVLLFSLDIT